MDTLVTIGCPYDLVRAFRPDYASARFWRDGTPDQWLNVYSPSDVLSSNFRDDAEAQQPTVGVELRPPTEWAIPENVLYLIDGRNAPVGPLETLRMRGLKFHGQYWSDSDEGAETVFNEVVPRLFAAD